MAYPSRKVRFEASGPELTRPRVLQAAITLIDADGLPALTMRRLGDALGVEAMALYRYVTGRDDLLDGVAGAVMHSLKSTLMNEDSGEWRSYLRRMADGVRRVAVTHPAVFPLLVTHPPGERWLRAPLRDPAWAQTFLSTMRRGGFTDAGSAAAYRAFTSFLTGHLLLDAIADTTQQHQHTSPTTVIRRYREFDTALTALVERLGHERARKDRAEPRSPGTCLHTDTH